MSGGSIVAVLMIIDKTMQTTRPNQDIPKTQRPVTIS